MALLTFRLQFFLFNGTSREVLGASFSPNVKVKGHPNELSVQIRLARIHFLQQNFEELDNFLKLPHPLDDASLEDRIRLSHLLSSRGFSQQALDIMYEARRTFFHESEAHTQYIALFFETEQALDPLLQVENVAENTAVLVQEPRGGSRWYTIEDKQDADIRKDELPLTHPLAKRLVQLGGNSARV
jgi:hypothetical protein